MQKRRSRWETVSAKLTLYDQQEKRELLEATGIKERSFGRLRILWSGDVGAWEEHDEVIMLCKFYQKCPARFFMIGRRVSNDGAI